MRNKKIKCRLCEKLFDESQMSEEHYPAHSVGNDDIVLVDIFEAINSIMSNEYFDEINKRKASGEKLEKIANDIFDNRLSKTLYPKGRTAKTLCIDCNRFLGKYDEAYLKFFNCDGNPKTVKGFQEKTKIKIIKSIYGKFLSVPETYNTKFDFLEFIRSEKCEKYTGEWNIYFVKRNHSTDLFFRSLETGKLVFKEGVVYELSDEKFIYNLMNFEKHKQFKMNNIFDILNPDYQLIEGIKDASGGYHGQILLAKLLSQGFNNTN